MLEIVNDIEIHVRKGEYRIHLFHINSMACKKILDK